MDLALHSCCAYPLIKQGIRRANHLPIRDSLSPSFALQNPSTKQSLSRTRINGDRRIWLQEKASMGKSKKGSVCCKKPSNGDPSKSNQEEIISLLKRIQSSISKGESRGVEEKENRDESSENKPLTKAILDVLEKSRKKIEGDTRVKEPPAKREVKVSRPTSSFAKRTRIPSALATRELKEVAKNRGIKGYSKLKKSELLKLLRSC
ncbi:hypothetical protein V5N11_027937 [Cardamine amara subsp. amara]|uniref:Rho termination factor-like N-terminal domain-containing protein n=1 Tax=Cardamine amara subsp. amara TaxID=228776 RepID=A0ABD1C5N8_CARAN